MAAPSDKSDESLPAAGRYEPFVLLATALAAGIFLDRQWPMAVPYWWLTASGSLIAWLFVWRRGYDVISSCLLLSAVAATGGAWHHCRWHLVSADHVVTAI